MSELAKEARQKMRAKALTLTGDKPGKVDASDYGPEETLDSDVVTGARPIHRSRYKRGGKVAVMEGAEAKKHAGRKPRKSGGSLNSTVGLANTDVVEANEKRPGKKHVGAFKRGGKADGGEVPSTRFNFAPNKGGEMFKKGGAAKDHPDEKQDRKLIDKMVKKDALTGKCSGGRTARATGGRTKGKTDINIVIAPSAGGQNPGMQPPNGAAPVGPNAQMSGATPVPVPMPQGAAGAPAAGAPAPAAMPQQPPMARKYGGGTYSNQPKHRGGLGRLERIKMYGDEA